MLTQTDKRVIYKEPLSDLVFEDETMNYELWKKLKDAGFPNIDICDEEICTAQGCNGIHNYPTLEELIEECGDGFLYLSYEKLKQIDNQKIFLATGKFENFLIQTKGTKPKEAIAKLCLELLELNK